MSRRRSDVVKRFLDVSIGGALLILTAPIQAGVAIAVRLNMGKPILFRQQRPGRDGASFTLIKFRTMVPMSTEIGLQSDGARLTRLGSALRRSSLDELPTLWNVVKGDMSLVGPRPLLPEYLPLYTQAQARRHEVRPGITGLAQVSGRNKVAWDERLALDVQYVDNRRLGLDLLILGRTITAVFQARGISADGHPTMEPFTGSSSQSLAES